jgi:hypothetical protein
MPGETDATRSRWPVHPAWRVVQSAFSDDASCEIGSLVFKRTKEANVRRAVEAVSGYITSIAAQGGDLYPELGQGYDDTMEWLQAELCLTQTYIRTIALLPDRISALHGLKNASSLCDAKCALCRDFLLYVAGEAY